MKKTFLTFVAVAFASCVAFAQTTPVQEDQQKTNNTEETVTMDRMSDKPEEVMAGRRTIKVEELPAAVQSSLKEGEFKKWKVVSVSEVQDNKENMANTQSGAQPAAPVYEVELVSEDMQDEIQDSQAAAEEIKEEAAEEGVVAKEKMVSVKVPGVVVRYDQQGKVISRVDRDENAPAGNEE